MIIPVIIYIIFLIIYLIFASFAIFSARRFGFVGDATKYVTIIFILFGLTLIIISGVYILGANWNQDLDLTIFS